MGVKTKFNELSVLAPLLTIYTCVYVALMGYDFAAKGEFDVPAGLMAVYIALVLAYAADKEIRRWTKKDTPPRKGALFVYAWMIFYLIIFIISSLRPEFTLPKDLTYVVLQVLGIFFGTKISKQIFQSRAQKLVDAVLQKVAPATEATVVETTAPQDKASTLENNPLTPRHHTVGGQATLSPEGRGSREEEIILNVIRKKGQAKREDLLPATGMSRSGLGRLLDEMEKKGLIVQAGERRASHYKLK